MATQEAVFVVGTAKHDTTQISISVLDPQNGILLDSYLIASALSGPEIQVLRSAQVPTPALAWLSGTKLQYVILNKFVKLSRPTVLSVDFSVKEIIDVGLNHLGQFVATTPDNSAHVVHLTSGQPALRSTWKFTDLVGFSMIFYDSDSHSVGRFRSSIGFRVWGR